MIGFKTASTLLATATLSLAPVAIAASALTVGSVMYAPTANAASFTGSLVEFTGDDAGGQFTFSDFGPNTVRLLTKITSPTVGGDIRGVFFDVIGGTAGLQVTPVSGQGAGITVSDLSFNTCNTGEGNNLNGGSPGANLCNFDVGFAVGRPGTAGGTITSALFTITRSGLTASSFAGQNIGIRYQATGANGNGSSKLSGTVSATAVPTPALLPGLIGMGLAALRKRKGEAEESAEA
ncbi:hypothetical protein C8255_04085 [filamentous cyanobacterium CCP3]|nr:hypothetical protein C8255_04085 [filamentous cyanobacterium CCP3]